MFRLSPPPFNCAPMNPTIVLQLNHESHLTLSYVTQIACSTLILFTILKTHIFGWELYSLFIQKLCFELSTWALVEVILFLKLQIVSSSRHCMHFKSFPCGFWVFWVTFKLVMIQYVGCAVNNEFFVSRTFFFSTYTLTL